MQYAWLNECYRAEIRSLDHCNFSCFHIVRQTNKLSALLDERRLPQSSDVLSNTVFQAGGKSKYPMLKGAGQDV
jgi:hypothetical protein